MYDDTGAPPSDVGAFQATVAPPKPGTTVMPRGADGASGWTAMISLHPSDRFLPPLTFCAVRHTVCSPSSVGMTEPMPCSSPKCGYCVADAWFTVFATIVPAGSPSTVTATRIAFVVSGSRAHPVTSTSSEPLARASEV